MGMKNYNK